MNRFVVVCDDDNHEEATCLLYDGTAEELEAAIGREFREARAAAGLKPETVGYGRNRRLATFPFSIVDLGGNRFTARVLTLDAWFEERLCR